MKSVSGYLFLMPFIFLHTNAQAMSGAGSVCNNNTNARQAAACLEPALKAAQASLKEKLNAVSLVLTTKAEEKELLHTQVLWSQYVGETCLALVKPASADEPIGYVDVLSCQTELTIERVRDLDRMFYVPLHD